MEITDPRDEDAWAVLLVAWMIAVAATLGAQFIGEINGTGVLLPLMVPECLHVPVGGGPRDRARRTSADLNAQRRGEPS